MARYLLIMLILFLSGCTEQQQPEQTFDSVEIAKNIPGEDDLFRKQEPLSLFLYYLNTEINKNEDTVIHLKLKIKNNLKDTFRIGFLPAPDYFNLRIEPEGIVDYYREKEVLVHGYYEAYKFLPLSSEFFSISISAKNYQAINGRKIRIGLDGNYGNYRYRTEEPYDRIIQDVVYMPVFWSDYITLKDEYKDFSATD